MITPKFERYGTNWEEKLIATDTLTRKEDGRELKVVLLRALQRLAQEAGLICNDCSFKFISKDETGTVGIMQAVYRAAFSDGTEWIGAADCNASNTSSKFMSYPTAVAESRAEARCLRKALGINMLSSEEVGFTEGGAVEQIESSPNKPIDSSVVKAIEKLCETKKITVAEVLQEVLTKVRNESIFELNELTVDEGQRALSWLNNQTPKQTKLNAAEERAARKQELLEKTKE